MRIGASIFAFFIIGLDIPLFSVLTRYNLVNSGLCSECVANTLVVYIPWALSWLFYKGDNVASLLSWGGVLFTSFVAFILPLALALFSLQREDAEGSINVYGRCLKSKFAQKWTLILLLVVASLAVVVAICGLAQPRPQREQYGKRQNRLPNPPLLHRLGQLLQLCLPSNQAQ